MAINDVKVVVNRLLSAGDRRGPFQASFLQECPISWSGKIPKSSRRLLLFLPELNPEAFLPHHKVIPRNKRRFYDDRV